MFAVSDNFYCLFMSTVVEFKKPGVIASAVYSGFGERLNYVIDLTNLEPPEDTERRSTWLATQLKSNKATVWHWFKDQPPKDANKTKDSGTISLHDVVSFLLVNTDNYKELNVIKVIGWMRYGDAVGYNPFLDKDREDMGVNISTMLIATRVLMDESSKLDGSPLPSESLVQHTSEYFAINHIDEYDSVSNVDREIVLSFIKISLPENEYADEGSVSASAVLKALKLLNIEVQKIADAGEPSERLVEQTAKYMVANNIESHDDLEATHKKTIGIFIRIATES